MPDTPGRPHPETPGWGCPQEYLDFRKERSRMLLSRRNQLLLEFSFWNEPQPRQGPNIYELRTYKLKVGISLCLVVGGVFRLVYPTFGGLPPKFLLPG